MVVSALEFALALLTWPDVTILRILAWSGIFGLLIAVTFSLGVITRLVWPSVVYCIAAVAGLCVGLSLPYYVDWRHFGSSSDLTADVVLIFGFFYFGVPGVPIAAILGFVRSRVSVWLAGRRRPVDGR